MTKYYELIATNQDGEIEVIFGDFDKDAVLFEKQAEAHNLKAQGYEGLKVRTVKA